MHLPTYLILQSNYNWFLLLSINFSTAEDRATVFLTIFKTKHKMGHTGKPQRTVNLGIIIYFQIQVSLESTKETLHLSASNKKHPI